MPGKKRRRRRARSEVGMRPFANQVKALLKSQGALPRFSQDLTVIEDLARLAWHVPVLDRSLRELVEPPTKQDDRPLEDRLEALASDVEKVHGLCRAVRGPLRRLLKIKGGARGDGHTLVPFGSRSRRPTKDDPRPDSP